MLNELNYQLTCPQCHHYMEMNDNGQLRSKERQLLTGTCSNCDNHLVQTVPLMPTIVPCYNCDVDIIQGKDELHIVDPDGDNEPYCERCIEMWSTIFEIVQIDHSTAYPTATRSFKRMNYIDLCKNYRQFFRILDKNRMPDFVSISVRIDLESIHVCRLNEDGNPPIGHDKSKQFYYLTTYDAWNDITASERILCTALGNLMDRVDETLSLYMKKHHFATQLSDASVAMTCLLEFKYGDMANLDNLTFDIPENARLPETQED